MAIKYAFRGKKITIKKIKSHKIIILPRSVFYKRKLHFLSHHQSTVIKLVASMRGSQSLSKAVSVFLYFYCIYLFIFGAESCTISSSAESHTKPPWLGTKHEVESKLAASQLAASKRKKLAFFLSGWLLLCVVVTGCELAVLTCHSVILYFRVYLHLPNAVWLVGSIVWKAAFCVKEKAFKVSPHSRPFRGSVSTTFPRREFDTFRQHSQQLPVFVS